MKHVHEIITSNINDRFEAALAQPEDTEEVMSLLAGVAEWLRSRGSSQWGALLEGKDSHDTAGAIQRGDVYIFRQGGEIAGLVMLLCKPSQWDVQLWGDGAHDDDKAVYLHRLAIKRKYAHTGLGGSILNWCSNGVRFADKRLIRLDCIAGNETLHSFYTRNGYRFVGEKDGFNTYAKALS